MQQLIPPQEKPMQCTLVILQVEIPCSSLTRLLELSVSTPIVAMSFPVFFSRTRRRAAYLCIKRE